MQEGLSPNHLKKAKLMFFYTRYPSSNMLKTYFSDVKVGKKPPYYFLVLIACFNPLNANSFYFANVIFWKILINFSFVLQ